MTAACPVPRANSRAASKRRASNAATSRRPWRVLPMPQHGIVPDDDHQSISRESLVGLAVLAERPEEPLDDSLLASGGGSRLAARLQQVTQGHDRLGHRAVAACRAQVPEGRPRHITRALDVA